MFHSYEASISTSAYTLAIIGLRVLATAFGVHGSAGGA